MPYDHPVPTPAPLSKPPATRRYLSSMVRREEILDAAFAEFSDASYDGTTIERIAARAGLSKAGVYAHFQNKEEIFTALLERLLIPGAQGENWLPREEVDLATFVDSYVDHIYALARQPTFLKALRLLVTERGRAPEVVKRWQESSYASLQRSHQAFIDACVEKGMVRPSVLTEHFWPMALSPFSAWMLGKLTGLQVSPPLKQVCTTSRKLLLDLLEPR